MATEIRVKKKSGYVSQVKGRLLVFTPETIHQVLDSIAEIEDLDLTSEVDGRLAQAAIRGTGVMQKLSRRATMKEMKKVLKNIAWKVPFVLSLVPLVYLIGNIIDNLNVMAAGEEDLFGVTVAFFILIAITSVHLCITGALGYLAFGRRRGAKVKEETAPAQTRVPVTSLKTTHQRAHKS